MGGNSADLRAYALTQKDGVALVLFNVNEMATLPVAVSVTGLSQTSSVIVNTYDRAIYDESQNNVWAGPKETKLGKQALPVTITLQPWSMNVVRVAK